MKKTISTYTLGCKLNFSESSAISDKLSNEYDLVRFGGKSDVTVINTCSVTHNANQKCRNVIRRALKHSPNSYVVVTGCYAQLEPQEIATIDGVGVILGTREKFHIENYLPPTHIKEELPKIFVGDITLANDFGYGHSIVTSENKEQTRAYLKVQDGCNYNCSYCTIPLARGESRSQSIDNIVLQAQKLIDAGYKEIVLTGVNIGDFGKSKNESFFELLQVLEKSSIPRIRISSIEPNLLTSDMISFIAESKNILPHFHIPMQSGCDEVLRLMRRRYTTSLYQERIFEIKEKIPHCCIGADVIVGSLGETSEHFEKTYHFIESLPISYLHVFTFSMRPNTHASDVLSKKYFDVSFAEKKIRHNRLENLSFIKRKAFYSSYVGESFDVLFEDDFSDNPETSSIQTDVMMCYGFTENYIRVGVPVISKEEAGQKLYGKIKRVKIISLNEEAYGMGEIIQ